MNQNPKYLYRIIKRVHKKKVVKLLVQQVKYPHRIFLSIRENGDIVEIMHKTPEWLKEFVDRLNKEEIKFVK